MDCRPYFGEERNEINMNEKQMQWEEKKNYIVFFIMTAGILIRIILAGVCKGHASDLALFTSWADRVASTGFHNFYASDVFTDYPPGYMYVLWLIGKVRQLAGFTSNSFADLLLIKTPAIIGDTLLALFLYWAANKKQKRLAVVSLFLIYLNPVIILNSAVWGQVDVLFTLCVIVVCFCVSEKKLPIAYFVFALGILIKPQTLIFTPVVLYGVWDAVFCDGRFQLKEFSKQSTYALFALISLLLLMAPFGIDTVILQYAQTMTSYPYATVNAFNIWQICGLNWVSQDGIFLGMTYQKWGSISIALTVLLSIVIWQKKRYLKEKYVLAGAIIIGGMFLFSVRMHERYLYPMIPLLILAYLYSGKKQWFYTSLLFSLGHFINVFYILYYATDVVGQRTRVALIDSIFLVGTFVYLIWSLLKKEQSQEDVTEQGAERYLQEGEVKTEIMNQKNRDASKILWLKRLSEKKHLGRKDIIFLAILCVIYALIAFFDLGDHKSVESFYTFDQEAESTIFDLGESTYITKLSVYIGNLENREFTIEAADDAEGPYHYVTEWNNGSVFSWKDITINDKGQYFRLNSNSSSAVLGEVMFYDFDGNLITPKYSHPNAELLYDEQDIYDGRSTFRNGTYFDEIYHARTAYEYIHGLYSYENTHPPLGKIMISIGIRLFGMNPFGWRFMGTLVGVLMIPAFYALIFFLFKSRFIAGMSSILFSFDFMHFAQTRIATIDVFVTFFILLMYLFLLRYFQEQKKCYLLLCGISMGLGIACKWTGIYAGAGLGILFFLFWIWKLRESRFDKQQIKHFLSTCGWCLIFFIVIPALIYIMSYLPFRDGTDQGLLTRLINNQTSMFRYHSGIDATHPFSSWWYQWPTMYRPIWYYSGTVSDTVKEGISAFGNPLVWWTGIPAFFYCAYMAWKEKDKTAIFLCVGYLAQYFPWFFVTRITFIYHYFPSVPFVICMIGYGMRRFWIHEDKKKRNWILLYVAAAVALFVMFYPVLSGMPVSESYVIHFLRWFDSWVLI